MSFYKNVFCCSVFVLILFTACDEINKSNQTEMGKSPQIVIPPTVDEKYAGSTVERFRVTAYCPCEKCCGKFADGITANGKPVTYNGGRFVAAPKQFPFGTQMDIPGYGLVEVIDRGGAIKGNRLDVFFPTHQEALNWGVKYLDVRVFQQ